MSKRNRRRTSEASPITESKDVESLENEIEEPASEEQVEVEASPEPASEELASPEPASEELASEETEIEVEASPESEEDESEEPESEEDESEEPDPKPSKKAKDNRVIRLRKDFKPFRDSPKNMLLLWFSQIEDGMTVAEFEKKYLATRKKDGSFAGVINNFTRRGAIRITNE